MTKKTFARQSLEAMGVRVDSYDDSQINDAFRKMVQFLVSDFNARRRHDVDSYTKSEVGYAEEAWESGSNPLDQDCAACQSYRPKEYACAKVSGKISPTGTCDLWSGFEKRDRMDGSEPTRRVVKWNGLQIGLTHEADRDIRFNQPLRGISYGRIYRSYGMAEDGKAIDCWVGPNLKAEDGEDNPNAYWYQQLNDDGSPDERKLVIGFYDRIGAKTAIQQTMPGYMRETRFGGLYPVVDEDLTTYRKDSQEDFPSGKSSVHVDSCDCGCEQCQSKKAKKKNAKINPFPLEDIEEEVQRDELPPKSFVGDSNPPRRPGFVYVPQDGDREAYWRRDPRQRRAIELPEHAMGRYVPTRLQRLEGGQLLYGSLDRKEQQTLEELRQDPDADLPPPSFASQIVAAHDFAIGLLQPLLPTEEESAQGWDHAPTITERDLQVVRNSVGTLADLEQRAVDPDEPNAIGNPRAGLRFVKDRSGVIQAFGIVEAGRMASDDREIGLHISAVAIQSWNLSGSKIWQPALARMNPDQARNFSAVIQRFRRPGVTSAMMEAFVRESQNLGFEGRMICAPLQENRALFSRAGFRYLDGTGYQSGDEISGYNDQNAVMELSPENARKFMQMRERTQKRGDSTMIDEDWLWQQELNQLEEESGGFLVVSPGAIPHLDSGMDFLWMGDSELDRFDGAQIWVKDPTVQGGGYWRYDPRAGKKEATSSVSRHFVSQQEFSKLRPVDRRIPIRGNNQTRFVTDGNREYLYKEDISGLNNSVLFAPREVLAAQVAQSGRVPNNQVLIVPKQVRSDFKREGTTGTLHTLVKGVNFESMRNHPGYADPATGEEYYDMYNHDGDIVRRIVNHPDLAKIYALDAFTGNRDRHDNNIMFDPQTKRFASIDMGFAFYSVEKPFAAEQEFQRHDRMGWLSDLSPTQKQNFNAYVDALKTMRDRNSPESLKSRMKFLTNGGYSTTDPSAFSSRLSQVDENIDILHDGTGLLIQSLENIRLKRF